MSSCPIPGARGVGRPEGTGANGVMILGEALGYDEVADGGLPFRPHGQAGSVLERAIRMIGATRDQFVVWNAVPTRPPNNKLSGTKYESSAIEWGRDYLEEQIQKFRPRCIVAVGGIPIRSATGLVGDKLSVSHLAGYVVPGLKSTYPPVVCSFHPAYLRRGYMSHLGVLMRTLRLAIQVARDSRQPLTPPSDNPPPGYILHPSEEQAREFLYQTLHQPEKGYLAYDIETHYSTDEEEAEEHDAKDIKSIQFSLSPGSGIYFPWREPYITVAKGVLASSISKLGWNNWRFDDPALRAAGMQINGKLVDLMWAWHHWQPDLPRKLQFAASMQGPRIATPSHSWPWPWKHIDRVAPQFYGIVDVDVLQWMVSYD